MNRLCLLRAPVAEAETIRFGFATVIGATAMKESPRLILNGGIVLSCFLVADLSSAQPAPPVPPRSQGAAPPPPPLGALAHNLQPETRGTARRFTLTPRGELDGFLLTDGTQVHLPPHLSVQLAAAVRIGDPLSVRGYRSPSVPLVVASATTDTVTNQTITDQGLLPPEVVPPPPPPAAPASGAQQASSPGRVQNPLYRTPGDLNGAVLSDGTMPPEASQVSNPLTRGQMINALGWALNTACGQVVDAQTVNPALAQMPPPPPAPQHAFAACAASTSLENATVDRRFFLGSSLREVPWRGLDSPTPPERPKHRWWRFDGARLGGQTEGGRCL
jgi:hypothetical protein